MPQMWIVGYILWEDHFRRIVVMNMALHNGAYGALAGSLEENHRSDVREKEAWRRNVTIISAFCVLFSFSQCMFSLMDSHDIFLFFAHNFALVVCALALGSYTFSPSTRGAEKDSLLICGVSMAVGCGLLVLYGTPHGSSALRWSGLILASGGAAGMVVCRAYVARITHPNERLRFMTLVSGCEYAGFSVLSILCERFFSNKTEASQYVVASASVFTLVSISFFDPHVQNAADTMFVRPYQHFKGWDFFVKVGTLMYLLLNFVVYGLVSVSEVFSKSSWFSDDVLRTRIVATQIFMLLGLWMGNRHMARVERGMLIFSVLVICVGTAMICTEYSVGLESEIYPKYAVVSTRSQHHAEEELVLPEAVRTGWLLIMGVAMPLKTAFLLSVFSRLRELASLPQLDLNMAYLLTAGVAGRVGMPLLLRILEKMGLTPVWGIILVLSLSLVVVASFAAYVLVYHRFKRGNDSESVNAGQSVGMAFWHFRGDNARNTAIGSASDDGTEDDSDD